MTPEQTTLVTENLDLVHKLAKRYAERLPRYVQLDDIVQLGSIGIMDAARRYNPARGVKFRTYAPRRILGSIMDGLRMVGHGSERGRKRRRALGHHVPDFVQHSTIFRSNLDHSRAFTTEDLAACPRSTQGFDSVDEREAFEQRLRGITGYQRMAVTLYFREGITMQQIGQAIGLSESRISQLITQALEILRSRTQEAA